MCKTVNGGTVNYKELLYYLKENGNLFREDNLVYIYRRLDKGGKVEGGVLVK